MAKGHWIRWQLRSSKGVRIPNAQGRSERLHRAPSHFSWPMVTRNGLPALLIGRLPALLHPLIRIKWSLSLYPGGWRVYCGCVVEWGRGVFTLSFVAVLLHSLLHFHQTSRSAARDDIKKIYLHVFAWRHAGIWPWWRYVWTFHNADQTKSTYSEIFGYPNENQLNTMDS